MEPLFDVFFAGEIVGDTARDSVISGLATLFKIDTAAANKLMNGDRHRIKRDCDKATALRYRDAIAKVGAKVIIERQVNESEPTTSSDQITATSALEQNNAGTGSRPDVLAQIAASPQKAAAFEATELVRGRNQAKFESYRVGDAPIEFPPSTKKPPAPVGENAVTGELDIAPLGSPLSIQAKDAPANPVIIPAYDLAAAGEPIPNLAIVKTPINPNIDHLSLIPINATKTPVDKDKTRSEIPDPYTTDDY